MFAEPFNAAAFYFERVPGALSSIPSRAFLYERA
jgi:hypothetical protein